LAAAERRAARGQIVFVEGEPCAELRRHRGSGEVRIYKLRRKGANRCCSRSGRVRPST
jgi:hypothetical protein